MKPFDMKKPPIVRLPPRSNFEIILARASQVSVILMGVVAFVFALHAGKFVLAPVSLAVVVGLMLGPVAARLERLGMACWLSSAVVFVLFVSVFLALGAALTGPLSFWAGELPRIWEGLQVQLAQLREPLEALRGLQEQIRDATGGAGLTVAVEDGTPVASVATLAPALLAQLLLFMGSLYFFVATRESIRIAVLRLCVGRRLRWRTAHIFRDVEALVSRYLLSITAINVAMGLAVTLGLWAAGVPSPALWGALAGLLNFIIYIGPAIMTVLLFVVGLGTYDTIAASLTPVAIYMAINLIEAQFVTPLVVGRTLTLNPFLVLLALAFWLWIWGPVGGFIAIPAVLIALAIGRNILPGLDEMEKS